MLVNDIKISEKFKNVLLESGIKELNPVQEIAIKKGLLDLNKSYVISAPTASGKTLIAEMFMGKAAEEKKCKAVYIVPLKALANEKYEEFKEKYEKLDLKVAISTGDLDSSDSWLQKYDIIILTSEKADSLLRHKAAWMNEVGVAVIDEIHLINDPGRGPTLEVTITKMKKLNPKILFLFLSATIKNADELADWIDAELVKSEWRPVKLYEGVYDGKKVEFINKEDLELEDNFGKGEILLTENTVKMGKQNLIFASTRRSAESIAENCGKNLKKFLSKEQKAELEKLSKEIENALDNPTKQCKRLANCIKMGTAFHHAGLVNKQRKLIEEYFKKGLIKMIAATPTLAAGVNLPAFRVLIRDAKRYYAGYGYSFIPVLEYQQMSGRAGRPQFDTFGESILIGKDSREAEDLKNKFLYGDTEPIYSKLAIEPILRSHVLALIATEITKTEEELNEFFENTFYGFQYGDNGKLSEIIRNVLDSLIEWNFVLQLGKELRVTKIGRRVSELYIDPESGHKILEAFDKFKISEFGLLTLISSLRESKPQIAVKTTEEADIALIVENRAANVMLDIPEEWDYEYADFLSSIKTAMLFEGWINEKSEERLNTEFGISPGELYSRIEIARWLLYACHELALLWSKKNDLKTIRKLDIRVKYGIKEELLPLVKLKGIGRVRARMLFQHGFRKLDDLRKAKIEAIAEIVGSKIAENIKKQIE